jgi:uncharacterized small protein (DUF1192 family)
MRHKQFAVIQKPAAVQQKTKSCSKDTVRAHGSTDTRKNNYSPIIMTTVQEMTQRVAWLSGSIKELEAERSNLIGQLSVAWSIGDLDEYIDDSGNAVVGTVKIERRSRTTWGYSPAVKALQEKEQHTGAAERKVTTYICVTDAKKK